MVTRLVLRSHEPEIMQELKLASYILRGCINTEDN